MRNLIIIFFCACATIIYAQNKTIALLEPRIGDGSTSVNGMEKAMVRGELRKAIVNIAGYEAITRANIDQMMKEHEFQRTGMVSGDQIKKLGIMSGADYICVSTLTKSNTEFYLEAYMINLETGAMSNPASQYGELVDGKLANLFPACQALAQELLGGKLPTYNAVRKNGVVYPSNSQIYTEMALGIDMKMILVEGGDFIMGCTPDQRGECRNNENITRQVTIDDFYIGMLEVTQSQWEKVMGTTIYQQKSKAGYNSIYGVGADYPMYFVNWLEATEFCRQLSARTGKTYTLPTEAQWEYAARGGILADNTKYAGSNNIDVVAWYKGNGDNHAHSCATNRANSLGIYDMSGNVYEWCDDWYSASYATDDVINPSGPTSGDFRVLRGGSWEDVDSRCRVAFRNYDNPVSRSYNRGFRVVCIP